MRNLFLFFGLLVSYTFIYTGISKFWSGVTLIPPAPLSPANAISGG